MIMKNLRQELNNIMFELDIFQKLPCSKEENKIFNNLKKNNEKLPDGVYEYSNFYNNEYYRIEKTDLTDEEIEDLMKYRQIFYLKSIKDSMIFFQIFAIISILILFVLLINI